MIPLMKTLSIVALASATLGGAEVASSSKDIVVLQPQDLPQLSRAAGQSMELLSPGNGRTYLYIEQQQLAQLLILDVTDMAHIKEAGVVKLDLPAAFDFASSAGPTASLIRFRGTGTCAILSYANPLHPTLSAATDPIHGTEAEPINRHGLLISESRIPSSTLPPRDYQIVDSSNLQSPHLLDTVRDVQQTVERGETGTTFLLGTNGLTIIRRPHQELRNWLESNYAS
jgi:hypothetical protein